MKYAAVLAAFMLAGCGMIKHELRGRQGAPGQSIVGPQGPQGEKGDQGETGPQGVPGEAAVLEVIDPCGDAPGLYDEVILRLANGQLLSSFSDNASGKNTRFSILTAGTYKTTDGSNCIFTVTAEGDVL